MVSYDMKPDLAIVDRYDAMIERSVLPWNFSAVIMLLRVQG